MQVSDRTKKGLKIIEAALLLGAFGDALLRADGLGINLLIWMSAAGATCFVLRRQCAAADAVDETDKRGAEERSASRWLLPCAFCFAAMAAWRDSSALKTLDVLAISMAWSLIMQTELRGARLKLLTISESATGLLRNLGNAIFGAFPLLLCDMRWREMLNSNARRRAFAIARAGLIAMPLLFAFAVLFASADAVFESFLVKIFQFDISQFVAHSFFTFLIAWLVGGMMRGAFSNSTTKQSEASRSSTALANQASVNQARLDASSEAEPQNAFFKIGAFEINLTLGLLNLLFFLFVFVQLRYFFGGAAWVERTTGLTYSEYARRGFFELVTVAALVLIVLLLADWQLQRRTPARKNYSFQILSASLIALLFVIMASALARMKLYFDEYGLTELRLYTTAFMFWLGILWVWFLLTVWRGARRRFAFGAFVGGLAMIALLHAINPDALIVRANFAHARAGHRFDAAYAASLSDDALPTLVELLPQLERAEQCQIVNRLRENWEASNANDWRAWSIARFAARRAVKSNQSYWQNLACPPPVDLTAQVQK
jgi:hypothetical protein